MISLVVGWFSVMIRSVGCSDVSFELDHRKEAKICTRNYFEILRQIIFPEYFSVLWRALLSIFVSNEFLQVKNWHCVRSNGYPGEDGFNKEIRWLQRF